MKKLSIFLSLLFISGLIFDQIDLFDHILAFLFVGLIPYTDVVIPPLATFFAWLSLPLIILALVGVVKGLFLLSLMIAEHIDRSLVAYQLSRTEENEPNQALIAVRQLKNLAKRRVKQLNDVSRRHTTKLPTDAN